MIKTPKQAAEITGVDMARQADLTQRIQVQPMVMDILQTSPVGGKRRGPGRPTGNRRFRDLQKQMFQDDRSDPRAKGRAVKGVADQIVKEPQ